MDKFFILQLVISFLVGGGFIATQSLVAERVSGKIAAIILAIPSTAAISFFFIGWVLSPQHIAEIAPLAIMGTAIVFIFVTTYLYLSKIKLPKKLSMLVSVVGAFAVWFGFSIPLARAQFSNLIVAFAACIIAASIAYYFVTVLPKGHGEQPYVKYTKLQMFGRALFAGCIITLAVFLSKTLNPFWGGIFSVFPAAFTSTFLILHWYYDSSFLFRTFKNIPLSSLNFIAFTFTAKYTFPAFGIIGGLATAYLASLVVFLILIASYRR